MRRTLLLVLLALVSFTQINCGSKSSPSSPGSSAALSFITNFGQAGSGNSPGTLSEVWGVAVSGDKVFVADNDEWEVQVFDLSGNFITYFWPYNANNDEAAPMGLAADKFGHLFMTESNDYTVEAFNINSIPVTTYGNAVTATAYYYTACYPVGLAVDGNGLLYVADAGCDEVYTITQTGISPGSGTSTDSGSVSINGGALSAPWGIAANSAGTTIYVADSNDNVVQVYDADFDPIKVIGDPAGAASTATGQFNFPAGLAVDNDGNLLVADQNNARVEKFSASGSFLTSFGDTANNINNGQFASPFNLAADADNNVYITDANYETVFKFGSN